MAATSVSGEKDIPLGSIAGSQHVASFPYWLDVDPVDVKIYINVRNNTSLPSPPSPKLIKTSVIQLTRGSVKFNVDQAIDRDDYYATYLVAGPVNQPPIPVQADIAIEGMNTITQYFYKQCSFLTEELKALKTMLGIGSGIGSFTSLSDTPLSLSSNSKNFLHVNTAADKLEFASNVYYDGVNVGIGVSSPIEALDIVGNVQATGFIGDGSQLTNVKALSISPKYSIKTADFTAGFGGYYLVDVSGGGIKITLPAATPSNDGESITFVKSDPAVSGNEVEVGGSNNIMGAATPFFISASAVNLTVVAVWHASDNEWRIALG